MRLLIQHVAEAKNRVSGLLERSGRCGADAVFRLRVRGLAVRFRDGDGVGERVEPEQVGSELEERKVEVRLLGRPPPDGEACRLAVDSSRPHRCALPVNRQIREDACLRIHLSYSCFFHL